MALEHFYLHGLARRAKECLYTVTANYEEIWTKNYEVLLELLESSNRGRQPSVEDVPLYQAGL